MNKIRKLVMIVWKDPVWSKVISVGALALLASVPVYHWWQQVLIAWQYVIADTTVPRWLFWFLVLWVASTIVVAIAILVSANRQPEPVTWRSYNEDEFFNLRWRWTYNSMDRMRNLCSFCRRCDYQLHAITEGLYYGNDSAKYVCTHCNQTSLSFTESCDELEHSVTKRIQLALRSGDWVHAKRKT